MGKNLLFVLGAPDHEMEAIETFLKQEGCSYIYATIDGKRVHPGNAYKIQKVVDERDIVYIECGFGNDETSLKLDHHFPGDPGFSIKPDRFMEGSSLGQTIAFIKNSRWKYHNVRGWKCGSFKPSKEQVLTAAADHCLAAAYVGECPGVAPLELLRFRAILKAAFQKRDYRDILADIFAAMKRIELAPKLLIGESQIADLRGPIIPELSEAGAFTGMPILAGPLKTPDDREKIVLQSAPPEVIEEWLSGNPFPEIIDRYGVPIRGIGGGYMK